MPFQSHIGVLGVVAVLIMLGGLGFPVLDELGRNALQRLRGRRALKLSLHSQVVLRVNGLLWVALTMIYLIVEWSRSFGGLGYFERLLAGIFQAVSARTAGFNVVDIGAMHAATLVLTCIAMFIGASPGSTGGGIKTTTAAALTSGLRAELTGRPPHLLDRRLPDLVIRKAIGIAVLSMTLLACGVVILLLFEPHPPLELTFEVVSAFSTTGLSTGVTPKLSTAGKLVIIFMMFAGRVGPLTLALALASRIKPMAAELPEERVLVG
jgi:trk system potassium uptake protein TrkH